MNFNLLSDLHLEHGNYVITNDNGARVLVLAGDIVGFSYFMTDINPLRTVYMKEFFKQCSALYEHVIYVAGNHEYWICEMNSAKQFMKEYFSQYPNIHFLDGEFIDIDDTRFIGATLWTNFNGGSPQSMMVCASMNDFSEKIKYGDGLFTVNDALEIHRKSFAFIDDNLSDTLKNVVVTHHAPSFSSLNPEYTNNTYNAGYATELGHYIAYSNIVVWVHGHSHYSIDYMIGDTRIADNPRGYASKNHMMNAEFKSEFLIEV